MTMMSCKGYDALVEYDPDADLFHGEVLALKDVITFQGRSVSELKQAFAESLDDYVEFCRMRGEDPEKPYSGQFVVRVTPRLHRNLIAAARREGITLNKWVTQAIEAAQEPHRVRGADEARERFQTR